MDRLQDVDHVAGPHPQGIQTVDQIRQVGLSGHLDNVSQWVTSETYFKKLPADIQKALTESADEAGNFMTSTIQTAEKETIEKMKKEGVTVIEVDRKLFREAAKPTYTHFPEWTPGLYDKVQSYLK